MNITDLAKKAGFIKEVRWQDKYVPTYIAREQELIKFAELLQQASEPVGEVAGWADEDGNIPVKWHDTPNVGSKLYTSPPNTQHKLDKAREALQKLRTETHDVYEGVGEKALINKLVNAGHIVDMALKEIE
jgi:hypothetical protein